MRVLAALAILAFAGVAEAQTSVPISQLPPASTPSGSELLPCVQGGVTKKCTLSSAVTGGLGFVPLNTNFAALAANSSPSLTDYVPCMPTGGAAGQRCTSAQLAAVGGTLTRAQIPTTRIGPNAQIMLAGYRTANDLGQGCVYSSVGATSTGWNAIQDSGGTWLNEVDSIARPGCFGAAGDDGATSISSGDITANPQWRGVYTATTTWDTVGTQEAKYYAFAGTSLPASGGVSTIVWNSTLFSTNPNAGNRIFYMPAAPKGKYGLNRQILESAQFVQEQYSQEGCLDWQGTYTTSMLYSNSLAYGAISNLCLETTLVGTNPEGGAPLWTLDHASAPGGTLSTQQLLITNMFLGLSGAFNMNGIAINPVAGGNGQGSTITFIMPELACGPGTGYAIWNNGSNALANYVLGGDAQGCHHDVFRNTGGAMVIDQTTTENQDGNGPLGSPVQTQVTLGGADYYSPFLVTSAVSRININRGEGEVGALCFQTSCTVNGGFWIGVDVAAWVANFPNPLGIMAHGSTAPGNQHAYMVVADSGIQGWRPIGGGSTTCVIQDPGASYTVNQWANFRVFGRFNNGFTEHHVIASNTATSLTLLGGDCFSSLPSDEYHIGGISSSSEPTWSGVTNGHWVLGQTQGGGTGQGFSTTAGSTTLQFSSAVQPIANGDCIMLPDADYLGIANEKLPGAFITCLSSVNTGAGTATMSRAATYTQPLTSGYWGTPITDNQLKWMELPFNVMAGINDLRNVQWSYGRTYDTLSYANVTTSRANWDYNFIPLTQRVFNSTVGQSFRAMAACPALGSAIDLTTATANDYRCTLDADYTVTAPLQLANRGSTLWLTFLSNGVAHTATFGTGFASGTPNYVSPAVGGAEATLEFASDGTQWNSVNTAGGGGGGGAVSSVFTRTGAVVATSGDYSCAQVTGCPTVGTSGANVGLLNSNVTWSGKTTWALNYDGTTVLPSNYAVIADTAALNSGIVGPRSGVGIQMVGVPSIGVGSSEEAMIDMFGYGGHANIHQERYNRGSMTATAPTSTSSPTITMAATPLNILAGATISDVTTGLSVGTVASTGGTTITLTSNAAHAVATNDILGWIGPNNGAARNADVIGNLGWDPYDGISDGNAAGIGANATEDQVNDTNHGTAVTIWYTPNAQGSSKRWPGVYVSPGGLGGTTIGSYTNNADPPTDLGLGTLHVASSVVTGKHFSSDGAAPTVSSCGSSPTVTGTDNAGKVHVGGATACTVTFHAAWANAPVCIVQVNNAATPTAYVSAVSTSAVTFTISSSLTGDVNYICQGVGGV